MNFGVILLIAFVVIFGGVGVFVFLTLKKMNGETQGVATKSSVMKTAQDFLPFANIENDILDLGGFQYRMIIEVSSVNYILKNEQEQEILEISFRNFLNSIDYPFSMFIQTREIDLNAVTNNLKRDINEICKTFPGLREYGENYYRYIVSLKERTGCTKQKRKFIIIPYDETIKMPELDTAAKKSYSYEQIYERANQIVDALAPLGLQGHVLNTNEIIELFYSLTHRNDDTIVDYIADGTYMSEYVKGRNKSQAANELEEAIQILQEAENKFNINVLSNNLTASQISALRMFSTKLANDKAELIRIHKNGGLNSLLTLEEQFNADKEKSTDKGE